MSSLLPSIFLVLFSLLLLALPQSQASAPALQQTPTSSPSSPSTAQSCQVTAQSPPPVHTAIQCDSSREEDRILCSAASVKQNSMHQVIAEDPTANTPPNSNSHSSENSQTGRADDVWAAAFNQWIANKQHKPSSESTKRAIEAARKRMAQAQRSAASSESNPAENSTFLQPGNDEDDDELKLITRATHLLQSHNTPSTLQPALILIDDLCASGDNGRQVAAAGGLSSLVRLLAHSDSQLAAASARALASCAQNNAPVFDKAVAVGAIHALVNAARRPHVRPAALRALLSVGVSTAAAEPLWQARQDVVTVITDAVAPATREVSGEERRGVVRALAIIELCVTKSNEWRQLFQTAGVLDVGVDAMRSEDVDVKEGAARVVQLLRRL